MHFVKVHEGFLVEGMTKELKHDLIHLTFENLADIYRKINYYSTLAAEEKWERKKVGLSIFLHATAAFLLILFQGRDSRMEYMDFLFPQ